MIIYFEKQADFMTDKVFEKWFTDTLVGRYTAHQERCFFSHSLKSIRADKIVQTGMAKWLVPSENMICIGRDVFMDASSFALEDESIDLLLMPHAQECCVEPEILAIEAFRVLKPEGKIVLTGFNPHSLWHFSRWFDGNRLPERRRCRPLHQVKQQFKSLGFEIEGGQFMVYVPPINHETLLKLLSFMELAGNRWWPAGAAVYGLVLVKRVAGVRPLPEYEQVLESEGEVALGIAKLKL